MRCRPVKHKEHTVGMVHLENTLVTETEPGEGTTFFLRLPVGLDIDPACDPAV